MRESILNDLFGEEEYEVCDILLNLKTLITKSESSSSKLEPPTILYWGAKRRRSILERPRGGGEKQKEIIKATSPATPLCFSPSSESDDKPQNQSSSIRLPKRRTKDELRNKIEDLTEQRVGLKRAIESVRNYHDELSSLNVKLRAMKEEAMQQAAATKQESILSRSCLKKEESPLENNTLTLTLGGCLTIGGQSYRCSLVPTQQPYVVNHQMSELGSPHPFRPFTELLYSNNSTRTTPSQVPPFDLNVPAENMVFCTDSSHSQPPSVDFNQDGKARAAEARMKRRMKMKAGKLNNAHGPHKPTRGS